MFREHVPHPALRPFVARLWARSTGVEGASQRVLPDGCIDVLVHLGPRPRAVAVGTMTRAFVPPPGPAPIIAARFRPGGATPLLRVPAHALTDAHVDGAELGLGWLEVEWLAARAPDAALRGLERLLLARVDRARPPVAIVAHAAKRLWRAAPAVAELAREVGWSRQHLARVFREEVGIGPKEFARVARLQRAVRRVQADAPASLAAIAADLGYFDQAHMARDFLVPLARRASADRVALRVVRASFRRFAPPLAPRIPPARRRGGAGGAARCFHFSNTPALR